MLCSLGVSCAVELGEGGARAVKEREVKGKVEALGLPARREMTPGVRSRGKRPRTNIRYASEMLKGIEKYVGAKE